MRFWNLVKWGGTLGVVLLVVVGALRMTSTNNTDTNSGGPSAGTFQQQGGSGDSDRYKNLKLN